MPALFGEWRLCAGHLVFDRACLLLTDLGSQKIADDLMRLVLSLNRRGAASMTNLSHNVSFRSCEKITSSNYDIVRSYTPVGGTPRDDKKAGHFCPASKNPRSFCYPLIRPCYAFCDVPQTRARPDPRAAMETPPVLEQVPP